MAVYVYAPSDTPNFRSIASNLDLPITSIQTDAEVAGVQSPVYTYVTTSRDLRVAEKAELDQAMLDRGYIFVR